MLDGGVFGCPLTPWAKGLVIANLITQIECHYLLDCQLSLTAFFIALYEELGGSRVGSGNRAIPCPRCPGRVSAVFAAVFQLGAGTITS